MYSARYTVPTLLGQYNQLASQMGVDCFIDRKSTLNTKYNRHPEVDPNTVAMQYFGIGIGGATIAAQIPGQPYYPPIPKTPHELNMDLYYPIPVYMVPSSIGLTEDEKLIYRLKTVEDGYDLYWLKKIATPVVSFKKIEENENVSFSFSDPNIFNPVDSTVGHGGYALLNPSSSDPNYNVEVPPLVVANVEISCPITGYEIREYFIQQDGNTERANITEYGLYTGEDRVIDEETEAVGVQLAIHRCLRGHDLSYANARVTEKFMLENGNSLSYRFFD